MIPPQAKGDDPEQGRINREASDWIAKYDRGFSPEEQDSFFHWLAQSPRHGEAYNLRRSMWSQLDVLAEWRPEHSVEPNPDLLAIRARSKTIRWLSVCTAMAAVFVVGIFVKTPWIGAAPESATMLTSKEGALHYENHILADGSVVELNRGAKLSTSFTADLRMVYLSAGEAHFTVAKDPNRPFVVKARNTVVKAIGTAFNVSVGSEEVFVLVTEGRVLMTPVVPARHEQARDFEESNGQELHAGQGSTLSLVTAAALPHIEAFSNDEIARRLSWKNEVLEFATMPLAEVILEFNRRNHTQLVIEDPALGAREITATLRPNNLDGFIELLGVTLNVRAEAAGDFKIILRGDSD